MAISAVHHHNPWAFPVGLLGNIISIMVYLAPLPTFYRVYRKKSTEGFQSIPYVVALFSAMLWIYYAILKLFDDADGAYLLITINSIGCLIESIYISIFIIYAPKKAKILTAKLLGLLNFGLFSLILLLTLLLAKGSNRIRILGWFCVAFSACVFAAPLSIMRLVIRTRSVEFMPFSLSFFLTLSAVLWFSYGLLLKDLYIAIPNVLGFIFGVLQMVLYLIYKDKKKAPTDPESRLPVHVHVHDHDHNHQHNTTTTSSVDVIKLSTIGSAEVHPIDLQLILVHDHHQKNNVHEQVTDQQNHHQKEQGNETQKSNPSCDDHE